MTATALSGFVAFPPPFLLNVAGAWNITSYLLDASGEMAGFVFRVPVTGSITKVGFRTAAVTTSDANGYTIGLYNLAAGGTPNTASAYGGMAAVTAQALTANTSHTFTLATAATTAIAGDYVAAVIQPTSYADGNVNIASIGGDGSIAHAFPYPATNLGGWANRVQAPIGWIEYSGGVYYPIFDLYPGIIATETVATSGATNTELSLYFTLPVPARLIGFGGVFTRPAASSFSVILYDSSDSALQTMATSVDSDYNGSTASVVMNVPFATTYSLAANTAYHLALKPDGTGVHSVTVLTAPAAAALGQLCGGTAMYYRAKAGGSWASNTAKRPLFWLWLDTFDDGASVGGGMRLAGHGGLAA